MGTQKIIKNFLEEIKEDILMIDGGCSQCISDFVEGINETLKKYDLEIEASENRPMALQIKELSIKQSENSFWDKLPDAVNDFTEVFGKNK